MKRIIRLLPFIVALSVHFCFVVIAAYITHYSNGVNVMGWAGNYATGMEVRDFAISTFKTTRWLFPLALLNWVVISRRTEKKLDWISLAAASSMMALLSWPMYSCLVQFLERNWLSQG